MSDHTVRPAFVSNGYGGVVLAAQVVGEEGPNHGKLYILEVPKVGTTWEECVTTNHKDALHFASIFLLNNTLKPYGVTVLKDSIVDA